MSRPRTLRLTTALLGAALFGAPAGARAADPLPVTPPAAAKAELLATKTFSLAIGADLTKRDLSRLGRRDLVVVDGELVRPSHVKALQARGVIVLGYLSVGSVESWRGWFPLLKEHRLAAVPGWPGERFTDLTKPAVREALTGKIAPQLLAKGLDGLFLDNLDVAEAVPAQLGATVQTLSQLSALVRGGGVLMAQNTDSQINRMLPYLDAWNREDPTGTYDFTHKKYVLTDPAGRRHARQTLRQVRAAGLLVTTTDYFASASNPAAKRAMRIACELGAVPFIGEITLSRVASKPQRC